MREVNIHSLDLNLLVALKALLEEKHVTRSAEKCGLSQPAMSRALGRLRLMFKDPLLVKGSGGLVLTARAAELQQPLQNILSEISQIMTVPVFEPAKMKGELVIATRDYELAAILPPFIQRVTEEAPGLSLRIVSLVGDDLSPLERNELDFVLSGTDYSSSTLSRRTLLKDNFVCLMAADNAQAKKTLTLERYLEMRHCLITISQFRVGIVDALLKEQGHERSVAVRVPHFLAAAQVVAATNLTVTLPRKLGVLLAERDDFVIKELPIKTPSFPIYLYWHIRNQTNPVHGWLRKILLE